MNTQRQLGLLPTTALVVGGMIGSGVFLLPASMAPFGLASLSGWVVTLAGGLLLAWVFSLLARHNPKTGGPYAYTREAFGELPAFLVAWSYWISVWAGMAAVAVAFAGSATALFPTVGGKTGLVLALAAIWINVAVNLRGIRAAGISQLLTTLLKLIPLLLFGLFALWWVDYGTVSFAPPAQMKWAGVTQATAALALWSLLGLESATIPADGICDPQRTIPRATLLGTLLAGVVTVLVCMVTQALVPAGILQNSSAPVADAARQLWGDTAGTVVIVVAMISTFGTINGWTLICARMTRAMADDGVFPAVFSRTDARGTPVQGMLIAAVLASVLVAANYSRSLVQLFTFTLLLSTAATLLPYLACSAAWLRVGRGSRVAASLALLFSLYALSGIGTEALLWGVALLVAGLPIYAVERRRQLANA